MNPVNEQSFDLRIGQPVHVLGARPAVFWVTEVRDTTVVVSGREDLGGPLVPCRRKDVSPIEGEIMTVDEALALEHWPTCNFPKGYACGCALTRGWVRQLFRGARSTDIADTDRRPLTFYAAIGDDLSLCPHCGAAVVDPEQHQAWHGLTGTLIDGGGSGE